MSDLKWFKSSFSEASGNACVEVAIHKDGQTSIRHSIYPTRAFTVSPTSFSSFVNAAKADCLIGCAR
ncbi:DUF397 domain-containing protein [Streptomyces sp. NPDC048277]|uniref:DUF397 domain-containing protein n=1 Tax=Streptomyces sp. NPDC048277 TaxID=3155027 RepID=UPI00340CF684